MAVAATATTVAASSSSGMSGIAMRVKIRRRAMERRGVR